MQYNHQPIDLHLSLVSLKSAQKKIIWSNSSGENEQNRGRF